MFIRARTYATLFAIVKIRSTPNQQTIYLYTVTTFTVVQYISSSNQHGDKHLNLIQLHLPPVYSISEVYLHLPDLRWVVSNSITVPQFRNFIFLSEPSNLMLGRKRDDGTGSS